MDIAAKIDDFGKPAWIALTIAGFALWWPLGLAILVYVIGSGRMACWRHRGWGRWQRDGMDRMHHAMGRWREGRWRGPSSGNSAFDEYRADTLRRLEDEEREFRDFLHRLRGAKDKAEFDQFMAERGRRPQGPEQGPEPQPQG